MDKVTADRLTDLAPKIQQFIDLHPDEKAWLYPLLGRAERRAIAVLEAIQGHHLSFSEVAGQTDSNVSTVRQILYALSEGGINFKISKSGKWQTPKGGRNRRLTRIE